MTPIREAVVHAEPAAPAPPAPPPPCRPGGAAACARGSTRLGVPGAQRVAAHRLSLFDEPVGLHTPFTPARQTHRLAALPIHSGCHFDCSVRGMGDIRVVDVKMLDASGRTHWWVITHGWSSARYAAFRAPADLRLFAGCGRHSNPPSNLTRLPTHSQGHEHDRQPSRHRVRHGLGSRSLRRRSCRGPAGHQRSSWSRG
jgi:hypothetical protein